MAVLVESYVLTETVMCLLSIYVNTQLCLTFNVLMYKDATSFHDDFFLLRWKKSPCLSVSSCCCDEIHGQKQLRERGGFLLRVEGHSLPRQGSKGNKKRSKVLKQLASHPQSWSRRGCTHAAPQLSFLASIAQDSCQGIMLPIAGRSPHFN